MDCFPDYCLACDKQISDGLYCSQACRLTDLERAGSSMPPSPLSSSTPSMSPFNGPYAYHSNDSRLTHPEPALDLLSPETLGQQRSVSSSSLLSDNPPRLTSQALGRQHSASCPSTPHRILSPSSSRSSLASSISGIQTQASNNLSEEDKNELRSYFHAFEHTRERRRQSQPTIRYGHSSSNAVRVLTSFADDEL